MELDETLPRVPLLLDPRHATPCDTRCQQRFGGGNIEVLVRQFAAGDAKQQAVIHHPPVTCQEV